MQNLGRELRLGWRLLRRHPMAAAGSIAIMALGISCSGVAYELIRCVVLVPVPYEDPSGLLFLTPTNRSGEELSFSLPEALDYRAGSRLFETLAFVQEARIRVRGAGLEEGRLVKGGLVTHDLFPMLGIQPVQGRAFERSEDGPAGEPVVVISYDFWHRHFGGRSSAVGETLELQETGHTIIGIMPKRFRFWDADVWLPLQQRSEDPLYRNRIIRPGIMSVARVKPGVSKGEAFRELRAIAEELAARFPETNRGVTIRMVPLLENLSLGLGGTLLVLAAVSAMVWLVACGNLVTIVLVAYYGRSFEMKVRIALGASRVRLLGQIVVETAGIAILGGVLASAFTVAALPLAARLLPQGLIPAEAEFTVDPWTFAGSLALATSMILLASLAVVMQLTRDNPATDLAGGEGTTSGAFTRRLFDGLAAAQFSLATLVLIGSGLLLRSVLLLQSFDPGFATEDRLRIQFALTPSHSRTIEQTSALAEQLLTRLRDHPEIRSAALSTATPTDPPGFYLPIQPEGQVPEARSFSELPITTYLLVSDGYFQVLGLQILEGRVFDGSERRNSQRTCVVNAAFVARHLANRPALGSRFLIELPDRFAPFLPEAVLEPTWVTIIGVVNDIRLPGSGKLEPRLYAALPQSVFPASFEHPRMRAVWDPLHLLIQSDSISPRLVDTIRRELKSIDPGVLITDVSLLGDLALRLTERLRFTFFGVVLLGALILGLSAAGIFGSTAQHVFYRRKEIGIRMALGCTPSRIVALFLLRSTLLALIGFAIGVCFYIAVSELLPVFLKAGQADILTLAGVGLVIVITVLPACTMVLVRAARKVPLELLT